MILTLHHVLYIWLRRSIWESSNWEILKVYPSTTLYSLTNDFHSSNQTASKNLYPIPESEILCTTRHKERIPLWYCMVNSFSNRHDFICIHGMYHGILLISKKYLISKITYSCICSIKYLLDALFLFCSTIFLSQRKQLHHFL